MSKLEMITEKKIKTFSKILKMFENLENISQKYIGSQILIPSTWKSSFKFISAVVAADNTLIGGLDQTPPPTRSSLSLRYRVVTSHRAGAARGSLSAAL